MFSQYNIYISVVILFVLVVSCSSEEPSLQTDETVIVTTTERLIASSTTQTTLTSTLVPPTETAAFTDTSAPTPLDDTAIPKPSETPTQLSSTSVPGAITDADGNVYPIIQFGDQWWMAANLNVTSDPDGNPITGYCYDNDEENCKIYGRLYTWDVAMNRSKKESASGICPTGWHIPSYAEWQQLITYLGGKAVAGGKMKDASDHYWSSPNIGATNESNFSALPAGFLDFTGEYIGLGEACFYRTSSAQGFYEVYAIELSNGSASITKAGIHPNDAIPIRCVIDSTP
jgi:uncharacterized protein (TIGR02145 family)